MRRQPEKTEQHLVLNLLRSVGAKTYTLGTRRRTGDYQGTMQTSGIPDVFAFLPMPKLVAAPPIALWVEVKAAGGRASDAQEEFAELCRERDVAHVLGGVDDVIAFLVAGGWLKPENVPHYRRPTAVQEV